MARIAGIHIPDNKRIEIALTYIYGVGNSRSLKILESAKIDKSTRTKDLTEAEMNMLREAVEGYTVEGDLRHETKMNIRRLKDIGCYRGVRHQKNLPARGQRSKTNNRTVRGNVRRTTGSGRKKAAEKT